MSIPVSLTDKNVHISDSALKYSKWFTKVPLHNQSLHPNNPRQARHLLPDSNLCAHLWSIRARHYSLFPKSEHFTIWHSRGVVLLMRHSDYDIFPGGGSLTSESYLAAQTAVGVTGVESLPCLNQKPASRLDVSGLGLWNIIHLWSTQAFGTQWSSTLMFPL